MSKPSEPVRLLITKLFTPPPPHHLVERSLLLEKLGRALAHPLTLVTAPAGYGKTSSVAAWLDEERAASAWLSLDEEDNGAVRFWRYIVAALSEALPDLDLRVADYTDDQHVAWRALLTDLVNALSRSERDLVLILDDYHFIENAVIHEGVAFLLEHLPPRVHLVMTGRSEPPLPLAKWRAQGRLLDIGSADLRFTEEEVAAFLRMAGVHLTPPEVKALGVRTEGWAAGVHLAALSLNSQNLADVLVGADRFVFDYLADEVLAQQPSEVQTFLLHTSLLGRFNAELCAFVTNVGDAHDCLHYLARANLFLVPLDTIGTWFRYHHLFAAFLQRRLGERTPERVPELYLRAAQWCEAHGLSEEAIRYVLAGGDLEGAVTLVEKHDRALLWQRDGRTTLRPWLEALPEDVIRARARLSLDHAWLLLGTPDTALLEKRIADAERLLLEQSNSDKVSEQRGELAIIRAERATEQGVYSVALGALEEALTLLSEPLLRGTALQSKGHLLRVQGDLKNAEETLLEAVKVCLDTDNLTLGSFALSDLGEVYKVRGQLSRAARTFERTLVLAEPNSVSVSASGALLGLADVLREQNVLEEAEKRLSEGQGLAESARYGSVRMYGALVLARLQYAKGELDEALRTLQEAAEEAARLGLERRATSLDVHRALLYLRQGDTVSAARFLRLEQPSTGSSNFRGLVEARYHFMTGDLAKAQFLFEPVLARAEATERRGLILAALVLKALLLETENETDEALEVLKRALSAAQAEGYVRVFLDEGEPMRVLLQKLIVNDVGSRANGAGYAPTLLNLFPIFHDSTFPTSASTQLLTKRELDVLELIAQGHSNQAIAEKLIRSVGTVKSHTSSIYSKLGVKSRTEAVARAKEVGLLS